MTDGIFLKNALQDGVVNYENWKRERKEADG
jgi:hypothetical protein